MRTLIFCFGCFSCGLDLLAAGMVRHDIPGAAAFFESVEPIKRIYQRIDEKLSLGEDNWGKCKTEVIEDCRELVDQLLQFEPFSNFEQKKRDNEELLYLMRMDRDFYLLFIRDVADIYSDNVELKNLYEKVKRHFQSQPSSEKTD